MFATGPRTAGGTAGLFWAPPASNLGRRKPSGTIRDTWETHHELSCGEFLLRANRSRTAPSERAALRERMLRDPGGPKIDGLRFGGAPAEAPTAARR